MCDVVDRVRVALNRDLQRTVGLTLAENLVLCQVAMAPGKSLRMVDIAGLLTIAKSAVTKTVDRLEDRGLITREKDPADRRTIHATLTADGERLFALAQPEFVAAVQRHFADHISHTEIRCLAGLPGHVPQPALSPPAPTVKEPRYPPVPETGSAIAGKRTDQTTDMIT